MTYPFRRDSRLIIIPVHLYGSNQQTIARLALDTGATYSLVNVHIAKLLGYDPAANEERIQITTGSGVEFVPKIVLNEIQALGITRNKFPIICHTLPPSALVDGLLGLDFFRNTILNLDFVNGIMTLTSNF